MKKTSCLMLALGLAAVLFLSTSADAYEFPPYQGILLKVLGNISESYSNNVTFASEEENKVEDFRTMLNFGVDFQYTGKRRNLGLEGRITRQLFEGSSGIRNPSEYMKFNFRNEFSKNDSVTLRNTFSHTQEPGSNREDFDLVKCRADYENTGKSLTQIELLCNEFEELGRFAGRFDDYSNDVSISYTRIIDESFNINTSYSNGLNWSSTDGTNDSRNDSLGARLNYKYSEATRFTLGYSYQLSSYEEGDDISRQSYNVGITQYITKHISLSGNVGKNIVSSGSNSVSLEATLRGELDEKTSSSLSYSQGTDISANQGDTFKNWQLSGVVTRVLLENLKSSLSAFYGQGEYSSTEITDTFVGVNANISYNFWRAKRGSSITGNLGLAYSDLESTDETREYTRNSVNSSMTVTF